MPTVVRYEEIACIYCIHTCCMDATQFQVIHFGIFFSQRAVLLYYMHWKIFKFPDILIYNCFYR